MWGAMRPFLSGAAMVVMVVILVSCVPMSGGQSPDHFGPIKPRHIGYRQKDLVIVRMILTLH